MKKKSRFLTGLLSAVMALSLFALPASADAENAAPTIDFGKNGSLTIYKYEGSDPSEEKLLDGVTFTAYKVAEIKQETVNGTVDVSYEPVQALKQPILTSKSRVKQLITTLRILLIQR